MKQQSKPWWIMERKELLFILLALSNVYSVQSVFFSVACIDRFHK